MKLPLSWLKEFVPNSSSPQQISDCLTMLGLEVEDLSPTPLAFEGIIVGKVVETIPHPNAEKLRVASVFDGSETHQVVCGAPNCRKGLTTAFAPIGARLLSGEKPLKIKKTKLRDVESFGMLCSGQELGLSEEHEGILELDDSLEAGLSLDALYGDLQMEIGLTPNLGHCFSALGVSRELSAGLDLPLQDSLPSLSEGTTSVEERARVKVCAPEACPRYACRVIEGIKVGPSPDWLCRRLEGCGMRSVNNVVDVTNYVMMGWGQPLHAFDYHKVSGGSIHVRQAKEGERFQTLDEAIHTLHEQALLICDEEKPLALAGVMGGLESEVSDSTTCILLESAHFDPNSVRNTSKKLGISTESSKRFERGCDPNMVLPALDRAAQLIAELCGGEICRGSIDQAASEFVSKKVTCRLSRTNQMLGTQLSVSEVEECFRRLALPFSWDGSDAFHVEVPTHRFDLNEEIELIEEVARVFGYDNIPHEPKGFTSSTLEHSPIFLFEREIRRLLLEEGLQEFLTCDLIGPAVLDWLHGDSLQSDSIISVLKPTSVDQSLLRPSLLPGLLQVVKNNQDHQHHEVHGFEVGNIHFKQADGSFKEQSMAAVILCGHSRPSHWEGKRPKVDFFDAKGVVENLLSCLGIEDIQFAPCSRKDFHPGRQADILIDGHDVGVIAEVHPSTLRNAEIKQNVVFAEINLHDLFRLQKTKWSMSPLAQFPGSDRDWTLTVARDVTAQSIEEAIGKVPSKLLKEFELTSLYEDERLGMDRKNITFNFIYRHDSKTLKQEAVDREHQRMMDTVRQFLGEKLLA